MKKKLLLNQARYIEANVSNITTPVDIKSDKSMIVNDKFEDVVNRYYTYFDERGQCTKVRLALSVNILATNIIFNSITEIVKNEGSDSCECLNFNPSNKLPTIGKPENFNWGGRNIHDAVMDTQLTNNGVDEMNYSYLCGLDILNNHILRSKSNWPVYYQKSPRNNSYNTIRDYSRDYFGRVKNKYYWFYKTERYEDRVDYQYKYRRSDIMTFNESLQNNLINNNGWVGFYNKGNMPVIYKDNVSVNLEHVINNEEHNKFIDLFPGRDRYEFAPHYNKHRKRYEKNWEYCLTYPCENKTDDIPFINNSINTLKIAFIDENENDDDGVYRCTIYTVSKHGLSPDDIINLYRSEYNNDNNSEIVEENVVVDSVIDDYVFTVYTSDWVCDKWVSVFDKDALEYNDIEYIVGNTYRKGSMTLTAISDYINIDFDDNEHIGSQNLSFAKVVDGIQCKYYVRVFSRFPNFEFYDKEVTEENIYSIHGGIRDIDEYSKLEYEKQSTQTKLGFARNVYGDCLGQIVYNDDIDISIIKDNLNRPLTSLYITFFKTNYGNEEWYNGNVTNKNIEWSRCFGKLNCGFEYSPYIDENRWGIGNINTMNNCTNIRGLDESCFSGKISTGDEIKYKEQDKFYGDLCVYSPSECIETVIQEACYRFNTKQRELVNIDTNDLFKKNYYDEIISDSYDSNSPFKAVTREYDRNCNSHPEGYFYYPNYEIKLRTFSTTLREFTPKMIDVIDITGVIGYNDRWVAKTPVDNYFNRDTKLYIYDKTEDKSYLCRILSINNVNEVEFECSTRLNTVSHSFSLYIQNVAIPNYAEIIPDKTGSYRWRDIIQNGFETSNGIIEEYPFVNGCFYVKSDINLYLRRQDSFGIHGLSSNAVYFGLPQITGEVNPVENGTSDRAKDSINEMDIRC